MSQENQDTSGSGQVKKPNLQNIRKRNNNGGGQNKGGNQSMGGLKSSSMNSNGDNMWKFYSEDSPGVKIGPVPVLVLSLMFIGSVFIMHIWGKYNRVSVSSAPNSATSSGSMDE